MYLAWIPQNIQKRVFLYILQQLSLFSGIELPNLEEVSFNNIHLRDVAIDPEKITQIPGIRLRHGSLHSVALKGSVKDGAHLEISGVDLVVAPKIDNLRQDIENAQALLAQSSADLTLTILLDPTESPELSTDFSGEILAHSAQSSDSSAAGFVPASNPGPTAENTKKPSSLGGVMSRAIDLALLKLQVRVTNITIKVLIEPADLIFHIDEIVFSYKTGVKLVSIKGVTVSVGRPFLDSGLRGHMGGNSGKSGSSSSGSDNDSDSDSDTDSDIGIDEEAEQSLTDSMVFTHEEASSIYMSATSQAFESGPEKKTLVPETSANPVPLLFIDSIDVLFQNVSPLSNLRVDIHTINVAAVPLLPTVSLVLNSISKLFKLSIHQLRKRNSLRKPVSRPESRGSTANYPVSEQEDEDPTQDSVLEKFHIKRLEISLTSALDELGTFSSYEDEVNIVLANFTVKLKDENLTYGGLETFEILRYIRGEKSHVFHFDSSKSSPPKPEAQSTESQPSGARISSKRADIRFEHSKFLKERETLASELTILISRPGILNLDASSLKYLINLSLWLSAVSDNLTVLLKTLTKFNDTLDQRLTASSNSSKKSKDSGQIVLQTASFEAQLKLSSSCVLRAFIFPISYDKIEDQFKIPRINIDVLEGETKSNILTISDIHFHFALARFNSFHYSALNSAPRKSSLKSSTSLIIGDLVGTATPLILNNLLDAVKCFLETLHNSDNINCLAALSVNESSPEKSHVSQTNNLMNSIYSNQNRYKRMNNTQIMFGDLQSPPVSMRLIINKVTFFLAEVNDAFGGLELRADGIEVLSPSNGVSGHVTSVSVKRTLATLEFLLNHNSNSALEYPMIQFRKKGNEKVVFEIVCRAFLIDYYVNWLKLLQSPKDTSSSCLVDAPKDQNGGTDLDIRLIYHDFAVGMVPGRLNSKLYLTVTNGSLDIGLNSDQFYVKSSFRDLRLLLIDDSQTIREDDSKLLPSTIYSKLVTAGYVDIGQINLVHVGVTIIMDIDSIRQKRVSFTEELSLIDIKININDASIELCGDSCHTLLQTLSDLKEPVVFKNEEKYRVRVENDFTLPEDIFDGFGETDERINPQENSPDDSEIQGMSQPKPDDFSFVDEFYNESRSKEDDLSNRLSIFDLNKSSLDSREGSSFRLVESHFIEKEHPDPGTIIPFSFELNLKRACVFLHDGFDWKSTRKSIKSAVQSLGKRSAELDKEIRQKSHQGKNEVQQPENNKGIDSEQGSEPRNFKLTQTLFQSIHIETDQNVGTSNLVEIINCQVRGEDAAQEDNEAHTNVKVDKSYKDLKLKRSRVHKVSAECGNLAVKVRGYADESIVSGENSLVSESQLVNKVEVLLDTIDVKDNVQSSTWNRMLTYMNSLGERETGTNMLALTIENVKPDSRMPYTEAIISLKVLPLRLFVDQDTLGFVTRFFGFKDTRFALPADELIFIQKFCISPLHVKFDYKPKSIDYAGIRSGNNAELANFFILDGSDLKLKKAVIYGAHGFPKVGKALGQIYGPYIQKYQLSGLLSGLSPIKSILNMGNGVRDLVALPVQEYKRDGRVMYGLQKGTVSFAKSTTNELLRLGVKLASGAQVVLENLEEYFGGEGALARGYKKKASKEKKVPKPEKGRNLLESSQMLKRSVVVDADQYLKPMLYIHSAIDEEDLDPEIEQPLSSILVFNDESDDEDHEEFLSEDMERKITSLYSNQPANAKEGLKSAFKAMGKNLKGSKKKIRELRRELRDADTIQEKIVSVAKSSPVIVIRPLIGGTEAMMKTLIGISNGIDSRSLQESHDKYRIDKE